MESNALAFNRGCVRGTFFFMGKTPKLHHGLYTNGRLIRPQSLDFARASDPSNGISKQPVDTPMLDTVCLITPGNKRDDTDLGTQRPASVFGLVLSCNRSPPGPPCP